MEKHRNYCRRCGESIPEGAYLCADCAKEAESSGEAEVGEGSEVCEKAPTPRGKQKKSRNASGGLRTCKRSTALLLCLFLGRFGCHKFYEGNTRMGVLYLLTGGLFGIGCIVDFFRLCGKPKFYTV